MQHVNIHVFSNLTIVALVYQEVCFRSQLTLPVLEWITFAVASVEPVRIRLLSGWQSIHTTDEE